MTPPLDVELRIGQDQDSAGVIDLITTIFGEYPNCYMDVENEEQKLLSPATSYDGFWVLDRGGEIVGCIACSFDLSSQHFELQKLYVAADLRKGGWGRRLVRVVENHARELQIPEIELWTDTRFETAHRFYQGLGYLRTGRTRKLNDISHTVEYHFVRALR
ncbi:MAG: GNAT family N-acetyltransferase [Planctomycetes bacterium]|nr:GNAT family N-acetyltransferase [Planctomycetota bacterium]